MDIAQLTSSSFPDLWTIDRIVVQISLGIDDLLVNEDEDVFQVLMSELTKAGIVAPDWWNLVALPAFCENYTILYEKAVDSV